MKFRERTSEPCTSALLFQGVKKDEEKKKKQIVSVCNETQSNNINELLI